MNQSWRPSLAPTSSPRYLAIADALARDVREGALQRGDQLPTHRDLARTLGLTVGTVSRAYQEAARRGLVSGEVGRGTFVAAPAPARSSASEIRGLAEARHELTINLPPDPADDSLAAIFADSLRALADSPQARTLLDYSPAGGTSAQRQAALGWLAALGLAPGRRRVLLASGAQHAITLVLTALTRPGDLVVCEQLTYPGFKAAASSAGVTLEGVAVDEQGVVPEDLERACRAGAPKLCYLVPTIQNPTCSVLSPKRRDAVAEVLRRHRVPLLEDDIHGRLPTVSPQPIAARIPELAFYVASLSKALAPGLRTAYLVAPEAWAERLEAVLWANLWSTPPLTGELAARWMQDGTGERILAARRRETEVRQEIAREILAPHPFSAHPQGYQLWLPVPEPWRAEDFVAAARQRGVGINAPSTFFVGRGATPHAVRVCLGAPTGQAALREALGVVRELLDAPASAPLNVA